MKIRCDQNSIRLRLRKSELVQLRAEKWLETVVHFPGGQVFAWEIVLHPGATEMDAHFAEGRIRLQVPEVQAQQWMDSDRVGMEQFAPLVGNTSLHLLIEKDFPCKDRPDEDQSDFFAELAEDAPVKC
jgi:hypothetical protein